MTWFPLAALSNGSLALFSAASINNVIRPCHLLPMHSLLQFYLLYLLCLLYSPLNSFLIFQECSSFSHSFSILLQLHLLVISILTKMIFPVSWPPTSLAELERLFSNFSFLFCLSYKFGHNLELVITNNSDSSLTSNTFPQPLTPLSSLLHPTFFISNDTLKPHGELGSTDTTTISLPYQLLF